MDANIYGEPVSIKHEPGLLGTQRKTFLLLILETLKHPSRTLLPGVELMSA